MSISARAEIVIHKQPGFMIRKIILSICAIVLMACVMTGCQSPKAKNSTRSSSDRATQNNCYSLLHQLLKDQKNVRLLRFVKHEQSDVKALINKISENSATGAKLLEEYARKDPSIDLTGVWLPKGEAATRESIASIKEKELLAQKGDEFELTLLLTQTEALSYAWHLAKVASEHEPQPDRARALKGVSKDMENLYHEVFALLLTRMKVGK